jgi:hypothetical protein
MLYYKANGSKKIIPINKPINKSQEIVMTKSLEKPINVSQEKPNVVYKKIDILIGAIIGLF